MITDLLRWRHHNITVRGPSTASTAVCVVADPRLPRTVSATAAAGPPAMRDGTGGGRRGGAATKRRRWPGARRAARLRRFAALGAELRVRHAAAVARPKRGVAFEYRGRIRVPPTRLRVRVWLRAGSVFFSHGHSCRLRARSAGLVTAPAPGHGPGRRNQRLFA